MTHLAPTLRREFRSDGLGCRATVLVIGGSGFVGSTIVRAASIHPELQAISCGRRQSHMLDALGVKSRLCDAADPEQLVRAFRDVTYVVNCVKGNARTMIAATRNICAAARKAGVRRIVHISSMAVYGDSEGVVRETSTLLPTSSYGRAKLQCESIVAEFVARGGDAIVLRPGCVYGPAGEQWVGRTIRWLQAGRLGNLGELGTGYCNLTFGDDLARATIAALAANALPARTFNVACSQPWLWNEYFLQIARHIGVPPRDCSRLRMYFDAKVLAYPLYGIDSIARYWGMAPGHIPEPITPSLLRLWRQKMRLDVSNARTMLGFQETPVEEGVRLAVRSFHPIVSR